MSRIEGAPVGRQTFDQMKQAAQTRAENTPKPVKIGFFTKPKSEDSSHSDNSSKKNRSWRERFGFTSRKKGQEETRLLDPSKQEEDSGIESGNETDTNSIASLESNWHASAANTEEPTNPSQIAPEQKQSTNPFKNFTPEDYTTYTQEIESTELDIFKESFPENSQDQNSPREIEALIKEEKYDEALKQCDEEYLQATTKEDRAKALYRVGLVRFKQGELRLARDQFKAAKKEDPNNPDIHNSRAKARLRYGKLPKAEKSIDAALRLDPNNPEYQNTKGKIEEAKKSQEEENKNKKRTPSKIAYIWRIKDLHEGRPLITNPDSLTTGQVDTLIAARYRKKNADKNTKYQQKMYEDKKIKIKRKEERRRTWTKLKPSKKEGQGFNASSEISTQHPTDKPITVVQF